jgi:hypothetical protein
VAQRENRDRTGDVPLCTCAQGFAEVLSRAPKMEQGAEAEGHYGPSR